MRLYKGIVRTAAAVLLAASLFAATAFAMPLPNTPPEIDDTPVSHEAPPPTSESASRTQPNPEQRTAEQQLEPVNTGERMDEEYAEDNSEEVASILLIGAAIWYVVMVIGITGGRRGGRRR